MRTKKCLGGNVACNCAVAFREGNNIYGVYACDAPRPPIAIRYRVDLTSPARMTLSTSADKYTVCSPMTTLLQCYLKNSLYCVFKSLVVVAIKRSKVNTDIAVRNRNYHTAMGKSRTIWDHTVLPATRQR